MPLRVCFFICLIFYNIHGEYTLPGLDIDAVWPNKLRVSLPDSPNISRFTFQGTLLNKAWGINAGSFNVTVQASNSSTWSFEYKPIPVTVGDTIEYTYSVTHNSNLHKSERQTYFVSRFADVPDEVLACRPTPTVVRHGTACAGQIIFEDDFQYLREDKWKILQYIPGQPDYPFVSYQHRSRVDTVSADKQLIIKTMLQHKQEGFSRTSITEGFLDLTAGCTSPPCTITASGRNILPPVVSGRIKTNFAFMYGVIQIRAKLPDGIWVYPDILLEPLLKKYGKSNYDSGTIRIAGALGNRKLTLDGQDVGNTVLYGGILMNIKCRKTLLHYKKSNRAWADDYHVYSVRWEPAQITWSVDEEEWASITTNDGSLHSKFPEECALPRDLLKMGSKLAPFDDFFYLTIGLAVGGITEFEDNIKTNGHQKPWKNHSCKSKLHFWQNNATWINAWPTLLYVDYVKIWAL